MIKSAILTGGFQCTEWTNLLVFIRKLPETIKTFKKGKFCYRLLSSCNCQTLNIWHFVQVSVSSLLNYYYFYLNSHTWNVSKIRNFFLSKCSIFYFGLERFQCTTKSMFIPVNFKLGEIRLKFVFLPTTLRYPTWLFIGSVLIWHIYQPMSLCLTSRICKYQLRCSVWVTAMRWFFVMTWLWIVRIVCVSTLSQAT